MTIKRQFRLFTHPSICVTGGENIGASSFIGLAYIALAAQPPLFSSRGFLRSDARAWLAIMDLLLIFYYQEYDCLKQGSYPDAPLSYVSVKSMNGNYFSILSGQSYRSYRSAFHARWPCLYCIFFSNGFSIFVINRTDQSIRFGRGDFNLNCRCSANKPKVEGN